MQARQISDEAMQEIFDEMFNGGYVMTVGTMFEFIRNGEYPFKDDKDLEARIQKFFDDTYNG